jgi:hypothetical protein
MNSHRLNMNRQELDWLLSDGHAHYSLDRLGGFVLAILAHLIDKEAADERRESLALGPGTTDISDQGGGRGRRVPPRPPAE